MQQDNLTASVNIAQNLVGEALQLRQQQSIFPANEGINNNTGSKNIADNAGTTYNSIQKGATTQQSNVVHRMRFTIDIRSIKDQSFKALAYARYGVYANLGINAQFRTSPALEINNLNVEETFKNALKAYTFETDMPHLYQEFALTQFQIEIWHQDRLKKDELVGLASADLSAVLKGPVRKTQTSYVRTLDIYLPIDEVDENRKPVKQIASLRVIFYLEDLGPADVLRQREQELGLTNKTTDYLAPARQTGIVGEVAAQQLNSGTAAVQEDPERQKILQEMNSLEYKIIWELETWKKSEEARFRIQLKQKEVEFLSKLNQEWKEKELEKERYFKQAEASVNLLEQKLKNKSSELQKREQKLILVEDELQTRIKETARQLSAKDEEIAQLKKKQREERANFDKEKLFYETELEKQKQNFQVAAQQYEKYRSDQESSPIQLIRNELAKKKQDNLDLQKELEKAYELKEQYKQYYEKLRAEVIKQKKQFDEYREQVSAKSTQEMDTLKKQIQQLLASKQQENQQPNLSQGQQQQAAAPSAQKVVQQTQQPGQASNYPQYTWDKSHLGELERLTQERDYLLQTGDYDENDPLIAELNNQIAQLMR